MLNSILYTDMTNFRYLRYFSLSYLIYIIIIILIRFVHPAIIILIILFYSIVLCTNLRPWKSSYIFPIIFFLIIIRGLLIIFLYFSRLISNAKTQTPPILKHNTLWFIFVLLIPLLTKMFFITQPFYQGYSPSDFRLLVNYNQAFPTSKIYLHPVSSLTIIRILYLLVALILIIKISSPKIKSLRKIT